MSIDFYTTVQDQHAAEAPRAYRPHTTLKKQPFDWDALTPTCKQCGTKTGQVSAQTSLCPVCDPTAVPQEPPAAPRRTPAPRRARVPGTPRPGGRPRLPLDVDAAIEAYTGGQTIIEISAFLHVGRDRIKAALLEAGVELRDDRGRHWEARTCPHGLDHNGADCADCRETRNAKRRTGRPRVSVPNTRNPIDEAAVVRLYLDGATPPEIAAHFGVGPARIRRTLERHHVELRDDRKTHSGSKPKDYDPQLVTQVADLYLTHELSQSQVAQRLGLTVKIVAKIMSRYGIPGRKGETGRQDGAKGLRTQMAELGVSAREIKAWALEHGVMDMPAVGIPSRRVFDAYLEAHADVQAAS